MSLWGEAAMIVCAVREKWPSLTDKQIKAAIAAAGKAMRGKRVNIVQAQQALEDAVTDLYGSPTTGAERTS